MRQAIEEGFILDVLANYTTYAVYWRLLKKVEGDPRYDKRKAEFLLKSFVELHPHAIAEKVRVMVEHFAAQVQGEIAGKAKAMTAPTATSGLVSPPSAAQAGSLREGLSKTKNRTQYE